MPDWKKSMQQTFEYYIVDPGTWKDKNQITTVRSATIERDEDAETKGSASFNINERLGECYIRAYLVTIQNGIKERHPLGTFLVQTPSSAFDGRVRTINMDSYTPLLELKENPPPIGYFIKKQKRKRCLWNSSCSKWGKVCANGWFRFTHPLRCHGQCDKW